MNSLVLQFEDSQAVSNIIYKIRNSGTNLELAPMSFGPVRQPNSFNRLLLAGDKQEITDKLEMAVGKDWKKYIVQGEVVDDKGEK